ncbi:hypothetical protein B0T20DRAFT_234055 [Sordaria brevicollis]|uniref:Uncharacterized protein n=1 Tax=Sordaria brevicollis TaxID=83679 RepID=A0AAE0PDA1_SORBR|nr:hypothetical protein B0T20DRAFT_234055 [Sordaria brevicollis]
MKGIGTIHKNIRGVWVPLFRHRRFIRQVGRQDSQLSGRKKKYHRTNELTGSDIALAKQHQTKPDINRFATIVVDWDSPRPPQARPDTSISYRRAGQEKFRKLQASMNDNKFVFLNIKKGSIVYFRKRCKSSSRAAANQVFDLACELQKSKPPDPQICGHDSGLPARPLLLQTTPGRQCVLVRYDERRVSSGAVKGYAGFQGNC